MIQAIIPLITGGPDDILLSSEGEQIISHIFKIVRKCSNVSMVSVFCNHQQLFEFSVGMGIDASCIEGDPTLSRALPEHYRPWPALFSISKDTTITLILSPRNPLITVDAVENAISLILKDENVAAVTSVVASTVHPCQLFSGRLVGGDAGDIYLPDQQSFAEKIFFPSVSGFWYRNAGNCLVNTITGKRISGRQDYPETVEPDGSLLLLRKKWFCADGGKETFPIHGVQLSPNESVLLFNSLDYLRYRAKKQMIAKEKLYQATKEDPISKNDNNMRDAKPVVFDKQNIEQLAPGIRQVLNCLLDDKAHLLREWFPMKIVETLHDWWRVMPPHLDRISPFSLVCGDFIGPYGPTMSSHVIAAQAQHLPKNKGRKIVDLRSGFGGPARFLARHHGCKVHCIELDAEKVAVAIGLNKIEGLDHLITTSQGDGSGLQIEAESVECVWGHSWGLEGSYKPLLAEAHRILAPGGAIVNFCRSQYLQLFSQCGFSEFTVHTYYHNLLKKAAFEFVAYLENLLPFIAAEFDERTLNVWELEIEIRKTQLATNYDDLDWVLVEARK